MKKIAISLLGLILFIYIVLSTGIEAILSVFAGIEPLKFSIALLLIIPVILLKGFKQWLLLQPFKKSTSVIENTKIWLVGYFFGSASPAKSGESIRALYLKRAFGVSLGEGLAVVFLERVVDLFVLFGLAFIGLFFLVLFIEVEPYILIALAAFFVLFVVALLLFLKKEALRFIFRPFFNRFAPQKFKQDIRNGFHQFYESISVYQKKRKVLFAVCLITLISWAIILFQFYIIALSLGIEISLPFFTFIYPIIVLVEVLPISISGIGTRDAASVLLFGLVGVAAASAVSFSLCVLFFNLVSVVIGFVLFNSMKKPI